MADGGYRGNPEVIIRTANPATAANSPPGNRTTTPDTAEFAPVSNTPWPPRCPVPHRSAFWGDPDPRPPRGRLGCFFEQVVCGREGVRIICRATIMGGLIGAVSRPYLLEYVIQPATESVKGSAPVRYSSCTSAVAGVRQGSPL